VCSGMERILSGEMVQCAGVWRGFHLVGWYSMQWYGEDFVWWDGTACSGMERISSGGMLHCEHCGRVACYTVKWDSDRMLQCE